jgi:hypothetical protein
VMLMLMMLVMLVMHTVARDTFTAEQKSAP